MAVESLFNASRESLLKRVRIETANDAQTLALVDQSIQEVRQGFYSKLGASRVATILTYALVDNPSTEEELLRSTGASTEANWLTWLLAQRLPHLFMDNKASTGDMWNDEQLTRDTKDDKFLARLKTQIDIGLGDLQEPINTETGETKASSIGPDTTNLVYNNFPGLYPHGTNETVSVI